jgi:hypothetical protein
MTTLYVNWDFNDEIISIFGFPQIYIFLFASDCFLHVTF